MYVKIIIIMKPRISIIISFMSLLLQVVLQEKEYSKTTRSLLEGKSWNESTVLFSCHVTSLLNMLYNLASNSVSREYRDRGRGGVATHGP